MTLSQRAASCYIRAALFLSIPAQHSPEPPVRLLRLCDCATITHTITYTYVLATITYAYVYVLAVCDYRASCCSL